MSPVFNRALVVQVKLDAFLVVETDVGMDRLSKVCYRPEFLNVQAFGFEMPEEIFHTSIIQTIAPSGHATNHLVFLKYVFIFVGGILESLITMNQGTRSPLFFYGLVQCVQDEI
ncbi:hypothetical protein D3C74_436700 [compost metagenome]